MLKKTKEHHKFPMILTSLASLRFRGIIQISFMENLGHFYGKSMKIIGLKAPGNYSDQFWSTQISVLFCEEPKNFTIPWFLDMCVPRNSYLWIWVYQITSKNARKYGSIFKNDICCKHANLKLWKIEHGVCQTCKTGKLKIWKIDIVKLSYIAT